MRTSDLGQRTAQAAQYPDGICAREAAAEGEQRQAGGARAGSPGRTRTETGQ